MQRCWAVVLFVAVCVTRAEEAVVETRDGRLLDGVISLQENVLWVVNADRGIWTPLGVTNLSSALFKPRPPDPYLPQLYAAQVENDDEAWASQDIGWSFAAGSDSSFFGLRRIATTSTNIAGTHDSFRFTCQPMRGDREIVVRIMRVPRGPAAKAGLMVRESLRTNAVNMFVGLHSNGGGAIQYRERPGGETIELQRPDLFVPHWLKLRRDGRHFSAYKSGNGRRWTLVQELELPMEDEIFAGVAVTGINPNPLGARESLLCDNLQMGSSLPMNPYRPVVRLRSGSTVVGRIREANESELAFQGPLPKSSLALAPISRIDFQWVPYRYSPFLNEARPGILLANGDYIEGEFKGVQDYSAIMSSVLMGVRSYDLNQDVLCIVLRPPAQKAHSYEVSTVDGSRWIATDLQIGRNEVILQDTALGTWRLPIYELAEIRRFPLPRSAPSFAQNN